MKYGPFPQKRSDDFANDPTELFMPHKQGNRAERRARAQELARDRKAWPKKLVEVPYSTQLEFMMVEPPLRAWQSRDFTVLAFEDKGGIRLSVCRNAVHTSGDWRDGITWEDLQRLKSEAGYGDRWGFECFPPDGEVVNVANMRHVWIPEVEPAFGWR